MESGQVVGKHMGFHHWTIGQRVKLQSFPNAYYLFKKDTTTNNMLVVCILTMCLLLISLEKKILFIMVLGKRNKSPGIVFRYGENRNSSLDIGRTSRT